MSKNSNILKFRKPAGLWGALWREGLVTGSGTVGAVVLGGAGREKITLNHSDLFVGGYTGVLPDVSDKVKALKNAIEGANYSGAEKMLTEALSAKNYHPKLSSPFPLCDFNIDMPIKEGVREYFRSIDLENAEVNVSFKDDGTKFDRNLFVSRVNNIVCFQITKSGSRDIDCTLSLGLHDIFNNRTKAGLVATPDYFEVKAERGNIMFSARSEDGTDYGAVARVQHFGGSMESAGEKIAISGADRVLVFIKLFVNSQKEKEFVEIKEELGAIKLNYDKLMKEHANLHYKLYSASELSLHYREDDEFVDDLVLKTVNGNLTAALAQKLYNFGKYLLICSTSPEGKPCAPYGLFNGDYKAEDSTRNNYLQTQRLYNLAFGAGISHMLLPLFNYYQTNMDDYKKNAMRLFNCNGVFIPSLESPASGLPGATDSKVILNFNVAALICQMIYDYYIRTENNKLIKDFGAEFIIETAKFYEDLLKVNKTTNMFESPIGLSPFSVPLNVSGKNNELMVASNCTIDFVCAKQVFGILLELKKVANLSEEDIQKYENLLAKVPDIAVDNEGIIKEYISKIFETNNNNPHIPHLFPYNVGSLSLTSKRDFEKLVAGTAKLRFNNSKSDCTAGTLIDIAVALATVGDGGAAFEVLGSLTQSFVTNNLVFAETDTRGMGIGKADNWATYSIDKNTAFTLSLQNMFITSNKLGISLFRNLPHELSKGSLSGFVLGEGLRADIDFNVKRGSLKLKLKSLTKDVDTELSLPEGAKKVKGVIPEQLDLENKLVKNIKIAAGKTVAFTIKWANKTK
ncbi:MAG: glycoside hydrolase N-terminal domain-containing protein [Christensenellaceae bacterium]|jgi:alpha-L-fucosidase 2|nr:glycoside hydrolase N-terminal domain-containing protein [Christensenellaceae bacterium]